MIFNDRLLFIHNGKTGGRSCAQVLLEKLRYPIFNCHQDAEREAKRKNLDPKITAVTNCSLHSTLRESRPIVRAALGMEIDAFDKILVVIRHPFTLEFSFYKHLRKARVRERRRLTQPELLVLADGNFRDFVEHAPFHRADHPQEAFFLIDEKIPPNVQLIRFENLAAEFLEAVRPYVRDGVDLTMPHINRTDYDEDLAGLLTEEVKELLRRKHRYMFDSGLYSMELPTS